MVFIISYLVSWTVLAVISGAVGGVWRQCSVVGMLPGSILACVCWRAMCEPALSTAPAHRGGLIGILLLGYAGATLTGPRTRRWVDLPLDPRIVIAVITGFLFRGVFTLASSFDGVRRFLQWLPQYWL